MTSGVALLRVPHRCRPSSLLSSPHRGWTRVDLSSWGRPAVRRAVRTALRTRSSAASTSSCSISARPNQRKRYDEGLSNATARSSRCNCGHQCRGTEYPTRAPTEATDHPPWAGSVPRPPASPDNPMPAVAGTSPPGPRVSRRSRGRSSARRWCRHGGCWTRKHQVQVNSLTRFGITRTRSSSPDRSAPGSSNDSTTPERASPRRVCSSSSDSSSVPRDGFAGVRRGRWP